MLNSGDEQTNCTSKILSLRSPVFDAMFKTGMTEVNTGQVVIEDLEETTLGKLLEFIYTGKLTELEDHLDRLLYAADKYQITDLVGGEKTNLNLYLLFTAVWSGNEKSNCFNVKTILTFFTKLSHISSFLVVHRVSVMTK